MKKAILYCRVSSEEQAKGGSLKYQADSLRRYCKAHDIEVVGQPFLEDCSAKTFDRPEMNKICSMYLRKKKETEADGLLVLRWNRFTRDASDGWKYIEKFRKYGIEVNAAEEQIDFSIAESKITLSVYLSMAEVDNDKRSKATKDGVHQARKEGKRHGLAPYGYVNKRKGKHECWVEVCSKEARFVREAFRRVAYGIECPTIVWKDLHGQGMDVSVSTFRRMMRDQYYVGLAFVPEYGDEPAQYVKGRHKPLIDAKTFNIVQERMDKEKDKTGPEVKKVPDDRFYLRSILRCPYCGNTVYGSFSKGRNKRYAYYHCNHCGKYRISAEDANENMAKYLSKLRPNEAVMALYEAILLDIQNEQSKLEKKEHVKAKTELATIDEKIKKIQDKWFDGILDDESFKMMNTRLNTEKKALELQLEEYAQQPQKKEIEEKIKFSLSFLENMGSCISTAPIHVKLHILGSIFTGKIVFDNSEPRTATLSPLVSIITGKTGVCKGWKTKTLPEISESVSRGG